MGEFTDRLLILVVAATALFVFFLGWTGGLVEAELAGWMQLGVFGVLILLFLGLLIGIWFEFTEIDDETT